MLKIEVLGELALYGGEPPKRLNIRSLGRALAYLGLQDGRFIRRVQMAEDLWPNEGYSVSGNRLRVTLNRMKEIVGNALVVDRDEVSLQVEGISVDLYEYQHQILEALDEVDVKVERDILKSLLPVLSKGVLQDWDEPWLLLIRGEWRQLCLRSCMRLAEIATQGEDWELVRSAFEASRIHARFNVELWRIAINAMHQLGEIEVPIRELRVIAAESEDEEVGSQAQELLVFARELRDSLDNKAAWQDEQEVLYLGAILQHFLERYPVKAAEVLATPEFDQFFINDPKKSLTVFYGIWKVLETGSQAWIEVGLRIAGFHYLLYEWESTETTVNTVLPFVEEPFTRSRLIFYRSWSSFQTRDWNTAMSDIQLSEQILIDCGAAEKAMAVRMNRGSYLWHQGYFDEALRIYAELEPAVRDSDSPIDIRHRAVTFGNTLFIHIYEGRIEKAVECYEKCLELTNRINYRHIDAMLQTVAGYVFTRKGELKRGIELEIEGLRLSYARGGSRETQIGLEWGAGVLCEVNRAAEAVAVLDWVNAWRKQTKHERSFAEKRFADAIYDVGKLARHKVRMDPDESLRNVMAFVTRILRQVQNGL